MPGVVDNNIDLPEGLQHLRHQVPTRLLAGHIGHQRQALPVVFLHHLNRGLRRLQIQIRHHHIGPVATDSN